MRIKPLFRVVLLFLIPLVIFGCISIFSSHDPLHISSTGQSIIPLKKGKVTEIFGLDDRGERMKFQIRDVEIDPKDPEQKTNLYTVFYQNQNQEWQNLCQGDANFPAKAVVLQGSWNSKGNYQEGKDLVTFSCANGALGKCLRFGYKPWKTLNGKSLREYHQACLRMVRADYCGDGIGHTKDDTPINISDRLGIQKFDIVPRMSFEAAWGVDGAQCINHVRFPEGLAYVKRVCPTKLAAEDEEKNQCATVMDAKENYPTALMFNDSLVRSR
jgi:hypothetical protein